MAECILCGDTIQPRRRAELGYKVCLPCGDKQARSVTRCVVPMHKSNYILVTDPADLKGINNKGGFRSDR